METFRYKTGFSTRVPAQIVGEEITRLREANGGTIRPADVVESARAPTAPLHDAFTWDDTAAAERYRESEARRLISGLRIIVQRDDGPKRIQAFISVVDPDLGRTYLPSSVVMSDAQLRLRALDEALRQLEGWKRRFAHLEELADVFAALESAKEAVA